MTAETNRGDAQIEERGIKLLHGYYKRLTAMLQAYFTAFFPFSSTAIGPCDLTGNTVVICQTQSKEGLGCGFVFALNLAGRGLAVFCFTDSKSEIGLKEIR